MDEVDGEGRLRRLARLSFAVTPRLDALDQFEPDEDGLLDDVGYAAAKARGWKTYLSRELSVYDKVLLTKEGNPVCLRYTANRLTPGLLKFQHTLRLHRQRAQDAAVRAACVEVLS